MVYSRSIPTNVDRGGNWGADKLLSDLPKVTRPAGGEARKQTQLFRLGARFSTPELPPELRPSLRRHKEGKGKVESPPPTIPPAPSCPPTGSLQAPKGGARPPGRPRPPQLPRPRQIPPPPPPREQGGAAARRRQPPGRLLVESQTHRPPPEFCVRGRKTRRGANGHRARAAAAGPAPQAGCQSRRKSRQPIARSTARPLLRPTRPGRGEGRARNFFELGAWLPGDETRWLLRSALQLPSRLRRSARPRYCFFKWRRGSRKQEERPAHSRDRGGPGNKIRSWRHATHQSGGVASGRGREELRLCDWRDAPRRPRGLGASGSARAVRVVCTGGDKEVAVAAVAEQR